MKLKLSVSMEESTIAEIESLLKDSIFRSTSHFIEYAAKKQLSEHQNDREKKSYN